MKKIFYSLLLSFLLTACGHSQIKSSLDKMVIADEHKYVLPAKIPTPITNLIKTDTMNIVRKMLKPDYRLYMRTSTLQFEMLVDDVPLNKFFGKITESGGGLGGDNILTPVILKNGKHQITVKIYPRFGQTQMESHTYFEGEIYLWDLATFDDDNRIKLLYIQTPDGTVRRKDNSLINPLEGLPYYEMKGEFEATTLPFSLEGWTNSVNLKEEADKGIDIKGELKEMYDTIATVFENKDTARLKQMIQEREDMFGTAFYFDAHQKDGRWQKFEKKLTDTNYELASFPPDATLYYYGYGKITTILDANHDGIIKLVNKKDPTDVINFDFRFQRKKKGDKLTVI